jgi:hypothetical protein
MTSSTSTGLGGSPADESSTAVASRARLPVPPTLKEAAVSDGVGKKALKVGAVKKASKSGASGVARQQTLAEALGGSVTGKP